MGTINECFLHGRYQSDECLECADEVKVEEMTEEELKVEIVRLRKGLKSYANGEHYMVGDEWETVSGEGENWLHHPSGEPDKDGGMIETGRVAKAILDGWRMPTEDELKVNDEAPMVPPPGYTAPEPYRRKRRRT